MDASEMGSTKHLKPHQFAVPDGEEPLGKSPISIRLYASDDEVIRAMGKDGRLFVRKAVRLLLQQKRPQGVQPPYGDGGNR